MTIKASTATRARSAPGAIEKSGVLECFYGPTWSTEDRRRVLEAMHASGMNAYVYGPAADDHTGVAWRSPYSQAERMVLTDAIGAAHDNSIDFIWRVSPTAPLDQSHSIVFSDPAETRTLVTRVREIIELGANGIVIAFDDAAAAFSASGDREGFAHAPHPAALAHATLANDVASALDELEAEATLIVCPAEYWSSQGSLYLNELTSLLREDIPIFWTGPQVVSTQLRTETASAMSAVYGDRALWFWDNYPVNDWGSVKLLPKRDDRPSRLMIGPMRGREADASDRMQAYLINGCSSAAATALMVSPAAEWAADARAYNPDAAWTRALAAFSGDDEALSDALRAVTDEFGVSPLATRSPSSLAPACWALMSAFDDPECEYSIAATVRRVREFTDRLARCLADVRDSAHPNLEWLSHDLRDWFDAMAQTANALAHACTVIEAHSTNDVVRLQAAAAELRTARRSDSPPDVPRYTAWAGAVIERASAIGGTSAPAISW